MIQDQINKLVPYISENLITYPLWEEGIYVPVITFWQRVETDVQRNYLDELLSILSTDTGYYAGIASKYDRSDIYTCFIYPNFIGNDNGGYKFKKKDWSIEEMLTMLELFIKTNTHTT